MFNKSISELAAGLRAGKFSSVELTRAFIDRINRLNGSINAFITVVELVRAPLPR